MLTRQCLGVGFSRDSERSRRGDDLYSTASATTPGGSRRSYRQGQFETIITLLAQDGGVPESGAIRQASFRRSTGVRWVQRQLKCAQTDR
jgi:hypothetical protein